MRSNSATLAVAAGLSGSTTSNQISLLSVDGDNADGPTVYPGKFAVDLDLSDAQNGSSGSISLWEDHAAAALSAPTVVGISSTSTPTPGHAANSLTDGIQDLNYTWNGSSYKWVNGVLYINGNKQ